MQWLSACAARVVSSRILHAASAAPFVGAAANPATAAAAGALPPVPTCVLHAINACCVLLPPLQSKFKPLKFSCQQRTALLTDLLQCVEAATAIGRCSIAPKMLG